MTRFDSQTWVTRADEQDADELACLREPSYWQGLLGWTKAQRDARVRQLQGIEPARAGCRTHFDDGCDC